MFIEIEILKSVEQKNSLFIILKFVTSHNINKKRLNVYLILKLFFYSVF